MDEPIDLRHRQVDLLGPLLDPPLERLDRLEEAVRASTASTTSSPEVDGIAALWERL